LTSSDSPQDIRRAYDSHVNSYVVKPSNLASFRQLVTDLQSYWIDWNARAEPQKTGPPCS
jgi:CheY-like chemotaxis protein